MIYCLLFGLDSLTLTFRLKSCKGGWAIELIPVTPEFERWRQKDQRFKANHLSDLIQQPSLSLNRHTHSAQICPLDTSPSSSPIEPDLLCTHTGTEGRRCDSVCRWCCPECYLEDRVVLRSSAGGGCICLSYIISVYLPMCTSGSPSLATSSLSIVTLHTYVCMRFCYFT